MPDGEAKVIRIRGARTHNLQNISLDIPRDRLVVVTGLSGSGKSSLAFDTIYAEGQRKYVESLSTYARQFLGQLAKPDVDEITGLPPTLAIAQQTGRVSPRSTVGTTTEVYDYLRLLFARTGRPHCPRCGRAVSRMTLTQIVDAVCTLPGGSRVMILAPLVRRQTGEHRALFARMGRDGFVRARVDGRVSEVSHAVALERNKAHDIEAVVDRVVIGPDARTRLTDSIEAAVRAGGGLVIVSRETPPDGWADVVYSERYACVDCDAKLPDLEPRLFSFNSPHGACPRCNGLGNVLEFDPELVIPDADRSLEQGAIEPWRRAGPKMAGVYSALLRQFCERCKVSPATPYRRLPGRLQRVLLHGTAAADEQELGFSFEGAIPNLHRRWNTTQSDAVKDRLHEYMSEHPCPDCGGRRLRPEALGVRIGRHSIHDLVSQSIDAAMETLLALPVPEDRRVVAEPILREVRRRLQFLIDVGVGYLTLHRASATLSGGEAQRVRLATQVGSGLVGVCYVLDEPSIGLHPRDNARLLRTLRELTDMGNTVLVVEHDAETIAAADWIVDIGPGAGRHGGRVLVCGPREQLLSSTESITAKYLRGELRIGRAGQRRTASFERAIEVRGAAENNLKKLDVRFPLGVLCCVTGVSGSGKSTLINLVLRPALARALNRSHERVGAHDRLVGAAHVRKVVDIDQSPIGRTPRSSAATYCGVFDFVRDLFAKTREAKLRGYSPARFSFNVKGGRCEACQGQGTRRIEMHFLPDLFVECPECRGTRYSRETLEIKYRGRSVADVLAMRVEEARDFLENCEAPRAMLEALCKVGLGYLALGQPASTLSGGEAQRVKLAAELGRPAAEHTLYLLDEPTTGLHFADIDRLMQVLNELVDRGHSIIVIEHNLDLIRQADWIIDLGPEGGEAGGRIVAEGTPEQIATYPTSHTGRFLRQTGSA